MKKTGVERNKKGSGPGNDELSLSMNDDTAEAEAGVNDEEKGLPTEVKPHALAKPIPSREVTQGDKLPIPKGYDEEKPSARPRSFMRYYRSFESDSAFLEQALKPPPCERESDESGRVKLLDLFDGGTPPQRKTKTMTTVPPIEPPIEPPPMLVGDQADDEVMVHEKKRKAKHKDGSAHAITSSRHRSKHKKTSRRELRHAPRTSQEEHVPVPPVDAANDDNNEEADNVESPTPDTAQISVADNEGTEQGMNNVVPPPASIAPDEANPSQTPTQDEVYSAYLAPDAEAARRRVVEEAVSATNVHVVSRTRHEKKSNWKLSVMLGIVVAASIGVPLAIILSRRNKGGSTPGMGPTMAPTSARFGQVASLVESFLNTTLQDPSSSQYQAAQWIADVDTVFEDLSTVDQDRFQQRYALAVFYFATGGPSSWTEKSFFLQPGLHECEWRDTPPNDTKPFLTDYVGVVNCSTEEWVQKVEIDKNNLTGSLPQELGFLSALTHLVLFENHVGGTLSPSLSKLTDLKFLVVWHSALTGTIPTEIGLATSLGSIILFDNLLTGTLPAEIGNLSHLFELNLALNSLTGSIPDTLLSLSDLAIVDFGENALTGELPQSLFSSWSKLEIFGLNENLLSGTIPNNLDSLAFLQQFVLGFNNFTGPFPSSITSLTNVESISVADNELTGMLPNDWNSLSVTLGWLQVFGNRLTGTLPQTLVNLSALWSLNVGHNRFKGTIPASLGKLTTLQDLQVDTNLFTGTVPANFIQLTSLRMLGFHRNKLTGDLSFLCNGNERHFLDLKAFSSDCFGEIHCPCCDYCCSINDTCDNV